MRPLVEGWLLIRQNHSTNPAHGVIHGDLREEKVGSLADMREPHLVNLAHDSFHDDSHGPIEGDLENLHPCSIHGEAHGAHEAELHERLQDIGAGVP